MFPTIPARSHQFIILLGAAIVYIAVSLGIHVVKFNENAIEKADNAFTLAQNILTDVKYGDQSETDFKKNIAKLQSSNRLLEKSKKMIHKILFQTLLFGVLSLIALFVGIFMIYAGYKKWIAYEKKADKILEEQMQKSPVLIQYFSSMKNKKVPNRKRRIN